MDEDIEKNSDEEAIRVLDLLTILIRRRNWVIWTTIIGTVATAVTLFLLPVAGINLAGNRTETLQATLRTVTIPSEAQIAITLDIPGLIQAQASNLKSVAIVYRETLMTSREASLQTPVFNRLVRTFMDKAFHIMPDNRSSTIYLTLRVNEQDEKSGEQFLKHFTTSLIADLKPYTTKQINQAISNVELTGKASNELAAQMRAPYEVASKALKGVLANPDFPLAPVGDIEPLADEQGTSRFAILLISFLGSFVLAVLLALVANSVATATRDPRVVESLRRAWKRE